MSNESLPLCPQCGAALKASAPAGLCPNCLMGLNLKTETVFTDDPPAAQPPLPPEQLAPHFPQLEILEFLGRGGMGVVYKARQKTLNRLVALKLLAPERVGDAKFAERFTREAQALAALNHPNIVTIHDFGSAGGFYYLLMEFVDGLNLRQLLRARKLTPEEALAIVPPLCDALQFAHDRGIIHRDIKPENLLLNKAGRVKVADFGIAKMLGGNDPLTPSLAASDGDRLAKPGEGTSLTGEQTVGTPGYSAPEQKTDPQRVDSRADIYSLGVVFYEMLTGELPGKRIEPPSRKVQIDVRLDEVVLRALEKKPALRYQQASEVKTCVETIAASPLGGSQREEAQNESGGVRASPGHSASVASTHDQPWKSFCLAFTFSGALLCGSLCQLLFGDVPGSWLVGIFVVLLCVSAVLAFALARSATDETQRVCFKVAAYLALIAALPLVGFSVFFLNALFSERGGWHPNAAEAVLVTLTWLGALLLPVAGWRLRRAARLFTTNQTRELKASGGRGAFAVSLVTLLVIVLGASLLRQHNARQAEAAAEQERALVEEMVQKTAALAAKDSFGPVIERVLVEVNEPGTNQAIRFRTGELTSPPAGGRTVIPEWMLANKMDLVVSRRSNQWSFITAGLQLRNFSSAGWDEASSTDVLNALMHAIPLWSRPDDLEVADRTYLIPEDVKPPLSFAFRTSERDRGLLQITGFTDSPRGVQIRYKLVKNGVPRGN